MTPNDQAATRPLHFIKAHATENDFVVILDVDNQLDLQAGDVAWLCNRRAGIGGDGLLRVVRDNGRWFMDYRNADGSIAEMCGNGIRAFAHVLVAEGLEPSAQFAVDTRAGTKQIRVHSADAANAQIAVDMGPVQVLGVSTARMADFAFAGLAIDVGNPHLAAVIPGMTPTQLENLTLVQPETDSKFFPAGVNVELLTELADGHVHMRVWERGVGETHSCGTGTVAAAQAALADAGREEGTVHVHVPGGVVEVTISNDQARLTGPATIVARGEIVAAS